MNTLGLNIKLPIYNADGTSFHDLVLEKSTYESVVMSLGDKITGDVYYKDNSLAVTMSEYVEYDGVKFFLVNPPTIVREGLVSENGSLNGMTKYSFVFYHPMYKLSNLPFSDIAVTEDEENYLSQNKTFSWVGRLADFVAKLNANLESTEWYVHYKPSNLLSTKANEISDVLPFDKNTIAEALKTAYDTWEVPFVIDTYEGNLPQGYTRVEWVKIEELHQVVTGEISPLWLFLDNLTAVSTDDKIYYCKAYNGDVLTFHLIPCIDPNNVVGLYDDVNRVFYGSNNEVTFSAGTPIGKDKKYEIIFGVPSNEIYDKNGNVFVFRFGQGVGLKNSSRNPRDNKIVTRIVGSGAERNVPYGYPQIIWTGNQDWDYTINNTSGVQEITIGGRTVRAISYPIYDGIIGGQHVKLIKHPFTRSTLMPTVYVETVNKKVNPNAQDYNPEGEIIDYYDAVNDSEISYPNPINPLSPSVENHQFEDIYPRLGESRLVSVAPIDNKAITAITYQTFISLMNIALADAINEKERDGINTVVDWIEHEVKTIGSVSVVGGSYTYEAKIVAYDDYTISVRYTSDHANFAYTVIDNGKVLPQPDWDDSLNENDEYVQSYFTVKLPVLSFDLYACAAITEEMKINMRGGACIGCTFNVMVDWEAYRVNFYDANGNFAPTGSQRDYDKFPDSSQQQIDLILQKDTETFGVIMPNIYQKPNGESSQGVADGDEFVILGISLPLSYISSAQTELDEAMKEYMLENNVYYFDYPLKFDEHFFVTHTDILSQIKNNTIVRFLYNGVTMALYVKQISIKYGEGVLPKYDITLTDDVEVVLNQIGQVTDDVSRMRVQISELQKYYSENLIQQIEDKLSRVADDVAQGRITFQQGLESIGRIVLSDEIRSRNMVSGLGGSGWRIDNLGNAELESLRVRSFLEVIELLVNRLQAQEGDTLFTDNDQIDKVEKIVESGSNRVGFILSLKEKYEGYVTCQMYGNILKGIINTLAAKQAGVSDESSTSVETDSENKFYTSWMRIVATSATDATLRSNQIRVVLYGDNDVPAGKNFEPCELMSIARWGCFLDPNESGITAQEKASRQRRQNLFYISTRDGRLSKLTGVNKPKLVEGNYGTTLGIVPDFINDWAIADRLIEGRDYLYAQGVIVGDFIKVDVQGNPITEYVDCGEWVDGSQIQTPTVGHGIYLKDEYNETNLMYETHDVWHNGKKWRCLQHQPVTVGSTVTYYEPTDNSQYWQMIEGGDVVTIDLSSSMDVIRCTDAGVPLSTQTVKTDVRMYRGTTEIQPYVASVKRNGVVMTVSTAFEKWIDTGVEVTFSLNSTTHLYELAVKYTSSATISNKRDVFSARIIDNPSSETFEGDKDFVINAVSGDVYNLVPSLTQINVGIVNGSYSPANVPISCQYTKRDVGGNITTSTESQAQGLIGGVYRIFVRLHSRTSGWGNFIRYGDSELHTYLTQTGITISMYDSLEFYLCTNTEIEFSNPSDLRGCIDKESVPVVSDGEDGEDGESAAAAFANPNSISVPCNTDGTTTALLEKDVTFSLKVGSNSRVTVQNVTVVNKPTAVTVTGRTSNVVTISIPAGTASSTLLSGVTLSVLGYITGSPTPLYSAQVTVALVPAVKGATGGTGARGKIGRWFYFGGVWEDIASDASFLINDAQAPYFKHLVSGSTTQYDFHVFNPETNPQSGSMTKAQMWSASSSSWNNSPWEIMTDDQKYYIAKAMFAEYAQFGSFIINGDWLISTKGTKGNDSNSQDYQSFDPFFVESKYLCVNATVDKVDTTEIICSHEFEEDKEYSIHLKANNIVRGTSYAPTLYVFISNGNSRVSDIIQLTESTNEYTFTFTPTDTGTYNVVAYFYHVPATCYLTADVTNVFVPNFAVDGLTGNSYQQSAYIRGTLQSTLILSETERVTQNITIDPANNPARIFILPYSGSALTVTLPDPKDYVGLELKFYTPMYSGTTPPTHILSASQIEYSTFAIVGSSYVRRTTSGTNFNVPRAFPVTLKAIDDRTWLVLEDVARGITTSITINGKVMDFVNGLLVHESFNT